MTDLDVLAEQKKGRLEGLPLLHSSTKLLASLGVSSDGDRCSQLEGDDLFSRDLKVLVAGESCARGASTRTDQAANQSSLAATGDAANQSAGSGAAANRNGGALALTFNADRIVRGLRCFQGRPRR